MADLEQPPLAATATPTAEATPAPERYLSCRFLERGATFYPGKVMACCANPATGKVPVLAAFQNGQLSPENLLAARKRIINRHKAGNIIGECRGCPRLTEEEWEKPGALSPYAIDEVTIAYFTSCNIRCNYCYTVTEPHSAAPLSKQPRVLPTFQQLIEQKLLAPNATVRFSGGEPTLSPEFEPLLELLTDYGVRSVVYTNATKRSEAIMKALSKDKVELVLGIDAATVQTYKAIKKMNYHDKVWKVVAEYCHALPPNAVNKVWAKFIFCLENYHEASLFVELAHIAGARHVYYDFDSSRVYGGIERGGIPLPEEICDHLAILRHNCDRYGIQVEFAQSGMVWFTPGREARVEREIERLRQQNSAATMPLPEAALLAPLQQQDADTIKPWQEAASPASPQQQDADTIKPSLEAASTASLQQQDAGAIKPSLEAASPAPLEQQAAAAMVPLPTAAPTPSSRAGTAVMPWLAQLKNSLRQRLTHGLRSR